MQQISLKKKKLNFQAREAFKMLRTNVEFGGEDMKVISVTSSMPGEGKSTIAYQLALSFAAKGRKTLLVDADLRKSILQRVSASGNVKQGLSDYLVGKAKLMDVLAGTDEPNFFIMFSGHIPPNPSELLGSARFEAMLESAKKAFDIVIIDTPPVGSVIDGVVVSSRTDGIVLVVKQSMISYKLVQRVKEQLQTAGGKIIGVALNGVDSRGGGYYGKYYGRYYGRYYGKRYGSYYGEYYGMKSVNETETEESGEVDTSGFRLENKEHD